MMALYKPADQWRDQTVAVSFIYKNCLVHWTGQAVSHLNLGKINIKNNTCFFSLLLISKHELLYKNYRKISIHIATGIFFPPLLCYCRPTQAVEWTGFFPCFMHGK